MLPFGTGMCISCHIVFSPRKPSLWSPVATVAPAQRGGGRTACPCVAPLSTGPHQPCEGCQELQQHGLEPRGGRDPSRLPSSLAVATTLWLDAGHRPSQACLGPLVEVPACGSLLSLLDTACRRGRLLQLLAAHGQRGSPVSCPACWELHSKCRRTSGMQLLLKKKKIIIFFGPQYRPTTHLTCCSCHRYLRVRYKEPVWGSLGNIRPTRGWVATFGWLAF